MWSKFGAGIWEALAKRYPDMDMDQVRCNRCSNSVSHRCSARHHLL